MGHVDLLRSAHQAQHAVRYQTGEHRRVNETGSAPRHPVAPMQLVELESNQGRLPHKESPLRPGAAKDQLRSLSPLCRRLLFEFRRVERPLASSYAQVVAMPAQIEICRVSLVIDHSEKVELRLY